MYVHIPTDKIYNEGQRFTFNDTNYPDAQATPEKFAELGFTEVTRIDVPPEDVENYYRTETRTGAVVTAQYTRKSDEQIKQQNNAKITAQIVAIETRELLNRRTRKGLLKTLDPVADKFEYDAVKTIDDEITSLRKQLIITT